MAMQAENMDYDRLKEIVDDLSCRAISPSVMPEAPAGSFTLASLPMSDPLVVEILVSISLTSLTIQGISTSLPIALYTR